MKTSRESRDKEEAKERAKRARLYAEQFPQFGKSDSEYTDPDWQLAQLKAFSEKNCPPKE